MVSPRRALSREMEEIPGWLLRHKPGGPFPRRSFFQSRVVFYPCSGTDGHPFETFAKAHAAHCFLYADWRCISLEDVRSQLQDDEDEGRVKGYRCITFRAMPITRFFPAGWQPTFAPYDGGMMYPDGGAFAAWAVLERSDSLDDNHGPVRLSLLHIGYEYLAAFERIVCQESHSPPYGIVLDQPYGNWTNLGGSECLLRRLLLQYRLPLPRWLFTATHVMAWDGYRRESGVDSCLSGLNPKTLHKLTLEAR